MQPHQKAFAKHPYLNSAYLSDAPHQRSYQGFPKQTDGVDYGANSKWKIEQDMRRELQRTQNEFKTMSKAYTEQNALNKKIIDFQTVNHEYHDALKVRNLDLNNRLTDLHTQNYLMVNKFEGDVARNFHQKDVLLQKFEAQAEELLQARRTINNLLEHKTKLEEQLQHLSFMLEKENDRFSIQMRQQLIKMEGLERSIRTLTETKDQQIAQLRNRIRIYEDENKRLNDQNRSLQITGFQREKQNWGGIDNLSQINYLDSQTKQLKGLKDQQGKIFGKQLQEQRHVNDKLQKQIDDLKKDLFKKQVKEERQRERERQRQRGKQQQNEKERGKLKHSQQVHSKQAEIDALGIHTGSVTAFAAHPDGLIKSIQTLRDGINREVFEVFYKSVKDGEKHRNNSLVIFISNWKEIDLDRIHPYILSYISARETLKEICLSDKYNGKPIQQRMQECTPLRIALRKGRNEINTWILSTIQFTKNQRQTSKKSINNLLLFLFRLLTIQYRITYPMQGKSYTIDSDVRNQLHHEIVKAVNYIIDFR